MCVCGHHGLITCWTRNCQDVPSRHEQVFFIVDLWVLQGPHTPHPPPPCSKIEEMVKNTGPPLSDTARKEIKAKLECCHNQQNNPNSSQRRANYSKWDDENLPIASFALQWRHIDGLGEDTVSCLLKVTDRQERQDETEPQSPCSRMFPWSCPEWWDCVVIPTHHSSLFTLYSS